MKAKDFLTESQYQQYRMLFEMDPSRRGFLKTLGKGALGVAGAAAMSAIPFSKAQASGNDKIQKIVKLSEKLTEIGCENWLKLARVTITGDSIKLSDMFGDKVPGGNGMITYKISGISRAPEYNGESANGYFSMLLKDYQVTTLKYNGTPYGNLEWKLTTQETIKNYIKNRI